MAECLGWPQRQFGFVDIVELATDPAGWSRYACAKPEWGREALLAFTYPSRSSTARSVLCTLYATAVGRLAAELTIEDVTRPAVVQYVKRFQSAVDCYVPDTLDLNVKIQDMGTNGPRGPSSPGASRDRYRRDAGRERIGERGRLRPGDRCLLDEEHHGPHRRNRLVERGLHRRWRRCCRHSHRRLPRSGPGHRG